MKALQYIWVPALAGLFFSACNTEPQGPTQAELDTQVEAKVKEATDKLKADCDARLLQAAQAMADSMMAKQTGKPAAPAAPKTKAPVKTNTPPPPPPKVDPKKDKMSGGGKQTKEELIETKKDKMSGQEPKKEEVLQEKKKKMSGK